MGYSTCLCHSVLLATPVFDRRGWFHALQDRLKATPYPDRARVGNTSSFLNHRPDGMKLEFAHVPDRPWSWYEAGIVDLLVGCSPGLQIETRALSGGFPKRELESGEYDLAIAAYFDGVPNGFGIKTVFSDRFVCICSKKNAYLKRNRQWPTISDACISKSKLLLESGRRSISIWRAKKTARYFTQNWKFSHPAGDAGSK